LLNIVNDILDISKIETGQITINNSVVHIDVLIKSLSDFINVLAVQKSLSLCILNEIPKGDNVIWIDESKLRQIITNLLGNSIKYTKKGFVQLQCSLQDEKLLFVVSDTGIGIAEEDQAKIFDRFSQLENELSSGTGLGLAISKGLTEIMGGNIWFESKINEGSKFYLSVPYAVPQDIEADSTQTKPALNFSPEAIFNKILIAEDEVFNYKLLEVFFKPFNTEILWAKNGDEAIEIVHQHRDIDFIFMDVKMPILGGIEATKQIKRTHPSIPIIAQSAFAFSEEREICIEAGCDFYLTKPIRRQDLLEIIQQYQDTTKYS